jgi:hypothetical protein
LPDITSNSPIFTQGTLTEGELAITGIIMPSSLKSLLVERPQLEKPKKPLDQFTLFPKLPLELRNKIWQIAAFEPRAIDLDCGSGRSGLSILRNQPKIPPILQATYESRQEGLRYYTPCTERSPSWRPRPSPWMISERTVYVNFAVDEFAIVLPLSSFVAIDCNFYEIVLGHIRNLIIDHTGYLPIGIGPTNPPDFLGLLHYLPRIEEINVMVRNWCAEVGASQCVGQELLREELHRKFQAYFTLKLKDARLNAELKVRFIDWNDSDTAACSVGVAGERRRRYFDPVGNKYDA